MKQWIIVLLLLLISLTGHAAAGKYHWKEDETASSQTVLSSSQSSRLIALDESQALTLIRKVMAEDFHLLLQPSQAGHKLSAQTTSQTILPGQPQLAAADYHFLLEIVCKQSNDQTWIKASARPSYLLRIADVDTSKPAVEISVKAGPNQAVGVGPMLVMPAASRPVEQILPDAAKRSAALVRAFMARLDECVQADSRQVEK